MTDRLNIDDIDWTTIVLYLVLVIFGWLNIFAVSYNDQYRTVFDLSRNYGDQLLWIIITLIMIVFLFAIDHRFYNYFAYPIYVFAIILLIAVLLFGTEVNNARSWFRIFGFNFQPSEFAKMAAILAIARYLSGYNIRLWNWKSMATLLLLTGIPAILIALQPDWGTALVFTSIVILLYREGMPGWILAMMLYFSGLFLVTLLLVQIEVILILISLAFIGFAVFNQKVKIIVIGLVTITAVFFLVKLLTGIAYSQAGFYQFVLFTLLISSVIFIVLAYLHKLKQVFLVLGFLFGSIAFTYTVDFAFHNILKAHQQMRVNILLGKETDVQNVGYNLNQSKIAIGSGGFLGKGFLQGTQTKLNFVPEQSTDFIFCTIGEEWGFAGTTLVIALFVVLLLRLIFLAERQKSNFARIYGYGVISIILFHFGINIAMTIGLFPVIGIPLPFFSYGGSSLLVFTLMLFIFIRLDSMRKVYVA